jgi:hypothetical protein
MQKLRTKSSRTSLCRRMSGYATVFCPLPETPQIIHIFSMKISSTALRARIRERFLGQALTEKKGELLQGPKGGFEIFSLDIAFRLKLLVNCHFFIRILAVVKAVICTKILPCQRSCSSSLARTRFSLHLKITNEKKQGEYAPGRMRSSSSGPPTLGQLIVSDDMTLFAKQCKTYNTDFSINNSGLMSLQDDEASETMVSTL